MHKVYKLRPYNVIYLPTTTVEVLRVLVERGPQPVSELLPNKVDSLGVCDEAVTDTEVRHALQNLKKSGLVYSGPDPDVPNRTLWSVVLPHPRIDASRLFIEPPTK